MNISIRAKIFFSFFLLVLLFVVNAVVTVITMNNNRKLQESISTILIPSLNALENFEDILVQSKMYSTNWVFIQSGREDKNALKKLHETDYPLLKHELNLLSSAWDDKPAEDSLKKIFTGFEQLMGIEQQMMSSLKQAEDYNDPVKKLAAEQMIQHELLPRTTALMNVLGKVIRTGQNIRTQAYRELDHSSMILRLLISVFSLTIIGIGLMLSLYMSKAILSPINKIRLIVNDLGKGIITKSAYKATADEIGDMVRSVNTLSERLQATVSFAAAIGNRNFNTQFEPLGADDSLGTALVAMRDNIKLSDAQLNNAQHLARIGSWERNVKTNKVTLSDEMLVLFDVDVASFDFQYESVMNFIHPDDREYIMDVSRKNLYMDLVSYECRIVTGKGIIKNVFVETKVVLGDGGEVEKTFGIAQDITERKNTEQKIANVNRELQTLFNSIDEVFFSVDITAKKLIQISDTCEKLTGYKAADFLADFSLFIAIVHPDDKRLIGNGTGEQISRQYRIFSKDNTMRWVETKITHTLDKEGTLVRLDGVISDISERKQAEEELNMVSQRLQLAVSSSRLGIFEFDIVNNILLWDIQMYSLYGISPDEFSGAFEAWEAIVHPDDIQRAKDDMQMAICGKKEFDTEFRIVWPNQSIHFIKANALIHRDEAGNGLRMIGTNWDITESKKAENALQLARFTVENATHAIFWITPDGRIFNTNNAALRMLGYTFGELITMGVPDIDPTYDEKLYPLHWQELCDKKTITLITRQRRKDGVLIDVQVDANYFVFDNIEMNCAFVYDITERKRAEEELQIVSQRLQLAVSASRLGIFEFDIVNNILFWDEQMYRLYGVAPDKFSGGFDAWAATVHPDDLERIKEDIEMAVSGKKDFDTEFRIVWPDQSIHFIKANALMHRDEAGNALRMTGTNWDITAKKKAENALQLAQFTVDNSTHAIYWIKSDSSFYKVNNAACLMLGYTNEELMERNVPGIDPLYDKEIWCGFWENLIAKKNITLFTQQRRKDGTLLDVKIDTHHIVFNNIEMSCAFVYDITEQKRAEVALKESEAFNKGVLTALNSHIAVIDENGVIIAVNKAWEDFSKNNRGTNSELTSKGSNYLNICKKAANAGDETAAEALKGILAIFSREKTVFEQEYQCNTPDENQWFLLKAMNFESDSPKVVLTHQNITERKNAEEALRTSEANLQAIFENTSDGFVLTDLAGNIKTFNQKGKEIWTLNSGKEMLEGNSIFDHVRESTKGLYRQAIPKVASGQVLQFDLSFERKNGETRWFSFVINRVYSNSVAEGFSITAKDTTQSKIAENTLRQSEERYRQVVETAQEGIWMIDENNYTILVNKKMADLLEYTPEEMMGEQHYFFMDEEWRIKASGDIERRRLGINENQDFKYITKSGKTVWTNLSTNPVFGDDGTYRGALAMVTDITQRKIDEELLRLSEATLETKNKELVQKNKELEQFAYVASHDLQEPLRTTASFVNLLQRQYHGRLDDNADKYLTYIADSAGRMQQLIKGLLDYSLIGSKKEFKKIDCNLILQELKADLGAAIKETAAVIKAGPLPVIDGNNIEIKLVFQNLIINAIKFRKKGITPEITIAAQQNDSGWEFSVKDNGIGIEEKYREKIFVIFQRLHTRTAYEGSGIGLSHCKKIVELHGGKIWIESTPGEGTTFHFTIQKK